MINSIAQLETFKIPNLRRLVQPDPGYVLIDIDLKGADARAVAWEADDVSLKQAFRDDIDIHAFNANSFLGVDHPLIDYKHIPELKRHRQRMKIAVHAVNYGCQARTLAAHINSTEKEAADFIRRWFSLHPAIRSWHSRINYQINSTKTITNVFGYKIRYSDRPEQLLPKALAWIGQSTTACIINRILVNIEKTIPEWSLLLQTHDSVTGQVKQEHCPAIYTRLYAATQITVPYPDPVIFPVEFQFSNDNWGNTKLLPLELLEAA